ncbi:hypothetical protein GCM10011584_03670 [Nocardioides phosphati]|uniref:DUF4115 domain-containing protein n=1 Tax=Nocardioides phosphati TaxID=1867775 RepID=A0ABQ2N6S3_9ACTN|nr:hypothetical protein [Nocardioides phosphati]GGO84930.1 hypothetical protein GCM10011584_03670 [Nocardioides phosphati]
MAKQRASQSQRRQVVEQMRAVQQRREQRNRLLRIVLITLTVAAVIAIGISSWLGRSNSDVSIPAHPLTTAAGRTTPPPWPAPADAAAAVKAAGLPMLGGEGAEEHIHAHLDVLVDGQPVSVPALIGIDESAHQISPLHTHDTSGVIHIESPKKADFSLGQFLTEWQVSVSQTHLGGLDANKGNTLTVYVNGKEVSGDPAAIILHAHDEIALVYGPSTQRVGVPDSYDFPSGE